MHIYILVVEGNFEKNTIIRQINIAIGTKYNGSSLV